MCRQIAFYKSTEISMGPQLQPMLLNRCVLIEGFINSNYQSQFSKGNKHLTAWVQEGELKYGVKIVKGVDNLSAELLGLFEGDNIGKMILEV